MWILKEAKNEVPVSEPNSIQGMISTEFYQ